MKAVLISINPKWCELIASGKKTFEVRKNSPKLQPPFKCYIYMTSGDASIQDGRGMVHHHSGGRCVIGEFMCNFVLPIYPPFGNKTEGTCLTAKEMYEYARGKMLYGWHISNLVIYDRPKELNEFIIKGDCDCLNCRKCFWRNPGNGYNVEDDCDLVYEFLGAGVSVKPLFRPPQSWCYVEGLK